MSLGNPNVPPWYNPAATSTTVPYCTDEAILIRAAGDFVTLCPAGQHLASGKDGTVAPGVSPITAGASTLASDSIDFSTRGIGPGSVVQLAGPSPPVRPGGDLLVVDSLAGSALVLRRIGLAVGLGDSVIRGASATKIEYAIPTLLPQILKASYDLDRRYGINDLVFGRRHVDLFDPREVEDVAVLTVLKNQYFAQGRQTREDTFLAKAAAIGNQLDELIRRVEVLWRPAVVGNSTVSSPFSTRIVRG